MSAPLSAGTNYSKGWDSITAVDLNGDGADEIFFYREDGSFRYYDVHGRPTIVRLSAAELARKFGRS